RLLNAIPGVDLKFLLNVAFTATLCLLGACSSAPSSGAGGAAAAGSSIEVFGTIDASISHRRN
ncbi:hypothetical protein, partial [Stenotrophomonas sp. YIM B06876]|uniref:hypothetical protein n=1 Tax=Stenotrophomonas sp. YIM B06876 TaxID=3060211 RepID=UPI002738EBCC